MRRRRDLLKGKQQRHGEKWRWFKRRSGFPEKQCALGGVRLPEKDGREIWSKKTKKFYHENFVFCGEKFSSKRLWARDAQKTRDERRGEDSTCSKYRLFPYLGGVSGVVLFLVTTMSLNCWLDCFPSRAIWNLMIMFKWSMLKFGFSPQSKFF